MIIDFQLPAHFDKNIDYSLIQQVQMHLMHLKLQEQAHHIINLFEEHPELESFSMSVEYESDDEGGSYTYLGVYTVNINYDATKEEEDYDQYLMQTISEHLNDNRQDEFTDFYNTLSNESLISRTLVREQVAKAMGTDLYEAWQSSIEKSRLEEKVSDKKIKSSSVKL